MSAFRGEYGQTIDTLEDSNKARRNSRRGVFVAASVPFRRPFPLVVVLFLVLDLLA